MSTWNYRVMKRTFTHRDGSTEDIYGIHECYYSSDPSPVIITWSAEADVEGESVDVLRATLQDMLAALDDEVIDLDLEREKHEAASSQEDR